MSSPPPALRSRRIIDARSEVASPILERAKRLEARIFLGAHVIDTRGTRGVERIAVRDAQGHITRLSVDTLAMSGGWNPSLALSTHLGGRPRWADEICAFVPGQMPRGMSVAGAAGGSMALADALREGRRGGCRRRRVHRLYSHRAADLARRR